MPIPALKVPDPNSGSHVPERLRLAEHTQNPSCAGCHRSIDIIGYAFERFDGLGRLQEAAIGSPTAGFLAGQGFISALDGKTDAPFSTFAQFAGQLAKSEEARACFVKRWFEGAVSRQPEIGRAHV